MTAASLLLLGLMGVLAGLINSAVGSGSLLTLPVLLALGIPAGTAVRTNTVGMVFSTIGSVAGYRREIAAERPRRPGLLVATALVCSAAGSCLLLVSPNRALGVVVPVLIVVALALVVLQKRITAGITSWRSRHGAGDAAGEASYRSPALLGTMGAASVYGGYFTAAQGILYLGILGAFTGRPMRSVNAMKNLLSLVVNATAVAVYLGAHLVWGVPIVWAASAAIAVGSLVGGYAGSHVAKRLPENVLRGVIVVVALAALIRQVL